jgi:hypothetical protein
LIGLIVLGALLVALNVFALSKRKQMSNPSANAFEQLRSKTSFPYREREYYEDVGRVMNWIGLIAGVALTIAGVVVTLA